MAIRNAWRVLMLPVLSILVMGSSCEDCQSSTSPSSVNSSNVSNVRQVWSPYLNVHTYGVCESQKPYLMMMKRSGTLKGVRLGDPNNSGQQCASWMSSQGLEVLGLFNNEYLRSPDVIQIFSNIVQQNPTVKVWEIGNEVQGPMGIGAEMNVNEYTPIFLKLFYYAKTNHPNLILAPQSDSLDGMLKAGLDQAVRDGLQIITVHYYGDRSTISLEGLHRTIANLPATLQVWVTETGSDVWPKQINYVKDNYPHLRGMTGADRIYWYTMNDCTGFSLAKDPDTCKMLSRFELSPLFLELTDPSTRNGL